MFDLFWILALQFQRSPNQVGCLKQRIGVWPLRRQPQPNPVILTHPPVRPEVLRPLLQMVDTFHEVAIMVMVTKMVMQETLVDALQEGFHHPLLQLVLPCINTRGMLGLSSFVISCSPLSADWKPLFSVVWILHTAYTDRFQAHLHIHPRITYEVGKGQSSVSSGLPRIGINSLYACSGVCSGGALSQSFHPHPPHQCTSLSNPQMFPYNAILLVFTNFWRYTVLYNI